MSKDKKSKKKKKQKTIYIDDGRTIADMSSITPGGGRYHSGGRRGTLKEQGRTYIEACKMMFKPMLVTMGAICVIFLILYLVFEFAG